MTTITTAAGLAALPVGSVVMRLLDDIAAEVRP